LHGEPGQEVTGEDEKRQERRGASVADKGDKARQGPTKQDKQVVCVRKGIEKKGERKVGDSSLYIRISVTSVNDIRSWRPVFLLSVTTPFGGPPDSHLQHLYSV
jgi:hypothetical protein